MSTLVGRKLVLKKFCLLTCQKCKVQNIVYNALRRINCTNQQLVKRKVKYGNADCDSDRRLRTSSDTQDRNPRPSAAIARSPHLWSTLVRRRVFHSAVSEKSVHSPYLPYNLHPLLCRLHSQLYQWHHHSRTSHHRPFHFTRTIPIPMALLRLWSNIWSSIAHCWFDSRYSRRQVG